MKNEEKYIIKNETTDTNKKQEYWNTGIRLNKVDNLEPCKSEKMYIKNIYNYYEKVP